MLYMGDKLLQVKNLCFSFDTYAGEVQAVRGVNFSIAEGETLSLVGESGCGKSVTAKAINALNPTPPGRYKSGKILFQGKDLTKAPETELKKIRGADIRMIFQDPMTSLNPTMRVGKQIVEGIRKCSKIGIQEAKEKAVRMLKDVGLPNPSARFKQYPHEFSGGMRQRAMIALAMAVNPKLLIADEPTTALDVTTQAQILRLMAELQKVHNNAILMITHDLGVVAHIATRIAVMYAGLIVEYGYCDEIFENPQHPYTWGLLRSIPHLESTKKDSLIPIDGTPPDLFKPPVGCPFAARCAYAMKVCRLHMPEESELSDSHMCRCWLSHEFAPPVTNPVTREGVLK